MTKKTLLIVAVVLALVIVLVMIFKALQRPVTTMPAGYIPSVTTGGTVNANGWADVISKAWDKIFGPDTTATASTPSGAVVYA